jgi:hypothetical protein
MRSIRPPQGQHPLHACCAILRLGEVRQYECERSSGGTSMKRQSVLTCPNCGHQSRETMPTNACQFFYDCKRCGQRLKPKQGDCCVFCSYGTVPCPPMQEEVGKAEC